jgi:predicted DCC family thiol-disulfide oxidoreductase YuxK
MNEHPVILFDGVCNLCSSSVQFVIKRDTKNVFRFASLQSDFSQQTLREHHLSQKDFDSFVLLKNNKVYTNSTGALMVFRELNWAWPLLYSLMIIPSFIRNAIYKFIARRRYKWFGKKEECWLPSTELKKKFI